MCVCFLEFSKFLLKLTREIIHKRIDLSTHERREIRPDHVGFEKH